MSTTTDTAKTTAASIGREIGRILLITFAAIVIGTIGTLLLPVGSTAHFAFCAVLLLTTAIIA